MFVWTELNPISSIITKKITTVLIFVNPRKISWTWNLWKIWAKKTNNHSQIMAIVLIKSDSAEFFIQIYSQNHGAIVTHPFGG